MGDLFDVVTYDAGVSSDANGRAVVEAGEQYVFRLRNEARSMYRMAEELCDPDDVAAATEDSRGSPVTHAARSRWCCCAAPPTRC